MTRRRIVNKKRSPEKKPPPQQARARRVGDGLEIVLFRELPTGGQYLRMHWHKRRQFRKDLALEVRSALLRAQLLRLSFDDHVKMTLTRTYRAVPLDIENLYQSAKSISDVLIRYHPNRAPDGIGVIVDDSPRYRDLECQQRRRREQLQDTNTSGKRSVLDGPSQPMTVILLEPCEFEGVH